MVEYTYKEDVTFMRKTLRPYRQKNDVSNGQIIYQGEAAPGTLSSEAGWRIKKWTYDASGIFTDISFADGTDEFVKVWDDRASYDYDPDS